MSIFLPLFATIALTPTPTQAQAVAAPLPAQKPPLVRIGRYVDVADVAGWIARSQDRFYVVITADVIGRVFDGDLDFNGLTPEEALEQLARVASVKLTRIDEEGGPIYMLSMPPDPKK